MESRIKRGEEKKNIIENTDDERIKENGKLQKRTKIKKRVTLHPDFLGLKGL
jgi:hypothetical protein